MGDPELVARAQSAAVRLERSWDRWRRLHGLAAEQAQPVSSYVGYSLAEPWGRPRVVFGVGAEEAEQLSALLEQDTGEDSRFSQGQLWEPEAQPHRAQAMDHGVNGAQPAAPAVPGARQGEPQPEPPSGGPAGDGSWGAPDTPAFRAPAPGMPSFHPAPPADGAGPGQGISADLAGWTASELPGQASAGLALAAPGQTWAISQLRLSRPSGRPASMLRRLRSGCVPGELVLPESGNETMTVEIRNAKVASAGQSSITLISTHGFHNVRAGTRTSGARPVAGVR